MKRRVPLLFGVLTILGLGAGTVIADPMFVGQWQVDEGPFWTTNPPVYSGQEAAALLFGKASGDFT